MRFVEPSSKRPWCKRLFSFCTICLFYILGLYFYDVFYTTREHNRFLNHRWALSLLLPKCCRTLHASGNHLIYEVTYHHILPWWLFCYLLLNFVRQHWIFIVFKQNFFYIHLHFLSVYSMTEIPQKLIRRPFVAYNWIIYISIDISIYCF